MTSPPGPPPDWADDEPLGRPFLAAAPATPGGVDDDAADDVRPYLITSGRTPSGPALPLETLVRTTARGALAQASYEAAHILSVCREPRSIAEISAHLGVPVGVTRVLIADLAAAELLTVGAPSTRDLVADPAFIERLMHGVAAL